MDVGSHSRTTWKPCLPFSSSLSISLLYFPLSLDLGFPHSIRALKLSRAISILLLPPHSSQHPTNPFSSQNFKLSTNWSHRSVPGLKIRKTYVFRSNSTSACASMRDPNILESRPCTTCPSVYQVQITTSWILFTKPTPHLDRSLAELLNGIKIKLIRWRTRRLMFRHSISRAPNLTCMPHAKNSLLCYVS